MTMTADEMQIRRLIERWAEAVHAADMDGVLADHTEDIVMFDVPPPFFEWQKQGAAFEIVSLDVTAGSDVAFAHALLRCGTVEELKRDPDSRLRLTIGLRKQGGRWAVAHEHHSFPARSSE